MKKMKKIKLIRQAMIHIAKEYSSDGCLEAFQIGDIDNHYLPQFIKKHNIINKTPLGYEDLEKEYFYLKSKECDEVEVEWGIIRFEVGDWLWNDHFKTANKVKLIDVNYDNVEFYFREKNGISSGTYHHVSNSDKIGKHRSATVEEIKIRLREEITNTKLT